MSALATSAVPAPRCQLGSVSPRCAWRLPASSPRDVDFRLVLDLFVSYFIEAEAQDEGVRPPVVMERLEGECLHRAGGDVLHATSVQARARFRMHRFVAVISAFRIIPQPADLPSALLESVVVPGHASEGDDGQRGDVAGAAPDGDRGVGTPVPVKLQGLCAIARRGRAALGVCVGARRGFGDAGARTNAPVRRQRRVRAGPVVRRHLGVQPPRGRG